MHRRHLLTTMERSAAARGWAGLLCVLVATIVPAYARASGPCAGDCNGDGAVTVDEIVHTVNAALGNVAVSGCPAADLDDDHTATVDEIVQSIVAALNGCAEDCPVRFDDVSASSELVAIASATAVAAGDLNADGFPDLYIGRAAPASGIYLENRGGWFVDATRDAALGGAGSGARSVLWADVDNDDDLDLLVGTERADGGELWINDGYGRFVDEAAQRAAVAGIVGDDVDLTDADGDGWIDVVAASPEGGAGAPGSLLRNRGAEFPGYFVPEPTSAGPATGEGSIHFDFDNDGDLDQAATAAGALRLWRNDEAALVDATAELGVASIAAERMVALDHDDDGDLDLLVMADGALRLLRNACGNRDAWIDVRLRGRHSHRGGAGARVQVTAHDGAIAAERMVDLSARRGTQRALAVHAGLGPGSRPARAVEVRWPSGAVQVVEAQPARSVVTIDEPPAAGAGPVFNDVTRAAGLWYTQQRFADAPACPSAAVLFDELLEGGERAAAAG